MVKKMKIKIIAMLLVCGAANANNAYICTNNTQETVKSPGYKTQHLKAVTTTTLVFEPNHTTINTDATGAGTTGTWEAKGRTITMQTDIASVAALYYSDCTKLGTRCLFVGASYKGTGTLNKDGTIFKGISHGTLAVETNWIYREVIATSRFVCEVQP
jgi:hypothetical protein